VHCSSVYARYKHIELKNGSTLRMKVKGEANMNNINSLQEENDMDLFLIITLLPLSE
jgi:uncharacterized protein YggU (UPF0235/DUF167 family)